MPDRAATIAGALRRRGIPHSALKLPSDRCGAIWKTVAARRFVRAGGGILVTSEYIVCALKEEINRYNKRHIILAVNGN